MANKKETVADVFNRLKKEYAGEKECLEAVKRYEKELLAMPDQEEALHVAHGIEATLYVFG